MPRDADSALITRFGGDPELNALLYEAIDRVATPQAREALLTRALESAGANTLPRDIPLLIQFVSGPLQRVARGTLGEEAAGALVSDVAPLLERVHRIRTSTPAPPESAPPPEEELPVEQRTNTLPPKGLFRSPTPPRSQPRPHGTLPYAQAPTAHPYVLLVDDDAAFLRGLSRMLRLDGYEVVTAPDGGSALRICERLRPAVVVTDYDMPTPNGVELARLIRERMGDKAPPVILLTGSKHPPSQGDGIARILMKTIKPGELRAQIEALLAKR